MVVTVREDVDCRQPGFFYTWRHVSGGEFWLTTVGDTFKVWIVSVGRTLLFIAAGTKPEATGRLKRQATQIVESIRFESVVKVR